MRMTLYEEGLIMSEIKSVKRTENMEIWNEY